MHEAYARECANLLHFRLCLSSQTTFSGEAESTVAHEQLINISNTSREPAA